MIKEIVQFVDALPPETFSRNLQLKEGMYMFLTFQGDRLFIDENEILWVNKNTEPDYLYFEFLKRYNLSKMITGKSMNSTEKIFIDIGTPYGISISGKGIKPDIKKNETLLQKRKKQNNALLAYFKAVEKYMNEDDKFIVEKYLNLLKAFIEKDLLNFFHRKVKLVYKEDNIEFLFAHEKKEIKIKDDFVFYFFLKSPSLNEYEQYHKKYLEKKVFLYDIKDDETHGICNELTTGNISKKQFMRHKTATFNASFKVDGLVAKKIYQFFNLKNDNKILPNPCPIFIDQDELNTEFVQFQKDGKSLSYKELIKSLLNKHELETLQNYYLIFFQGGLKKTQIVDVDFIPQFQYSVNQKIRNVFELKDKNKNNLPDLMIKNVFELEQIFSKYVFYQINTKTDVVFGILNNHYFSEKVEATKGWVIQDAILNLTYKYRKSMYDYIYKSHRQSITCEMFDTMMKTSILEDIRIDEYKNEKHSRGYAIKEKLNLWFSLYNFFNQNQNREDMASKIPELLEKMKLVANGESISFSENPAEFAFGAGQLVYFLLTKSAASNKSYAMLEPFLQKTQVSQLQNAISNSIAMYKHEIDISKGRFEKLASEILAYESDINMKDYLRYFLAGCFAQSVIYEKNKTESTN